MDNDVLNERPIDYKGNNWSSDSKKEFLHENKIKLNVNDNSDEIILLKKKSEILQTQLDRRNEFMNVQNAVENVKDKILNGAIEKISTQKEIGKLSNELSNIGKKSIKIDIVKQQVDNEKKTVNNKANRQQNVNHLIELKTEAIRLRREKTQILKQQKNERKIINKNAKWELHKDKLEKMNYGYVPNPFVLTMLLFFDGLKSFFDGLSSVSTAILKCFKWVLFIVAILGILMIIPVSREWILNLLKF